MKVSAAHRILAYMAAVVAVASIILAGVSRLIMQNVGLQIDSYMVIAAVALLFAIYFLVEGAAQSASKD